MTRLSASACDPLRSTLPETESEKAWSVSDQMFLAQHYPDKGKEWCAKAMNRSEASIRAKAARMGIRLNREGEFFKDFQSRAAKSKVGKKRPEQAAVISRLHAEGKMAYTDERRKGNSERSRKWHLENEHPRGALGLRHTDETKAVIGQKSRDSAKQMSDDQVYAKTRKALETRFNGGTYAPERKNVSWRGGWRVIGGERKYYRSAWEANYARYLEWLRVQGLLSKWEHEPHVFWFDGIKRGCVSYLPDFRVTENDGRQVYHEVKGWMDARSATKIKRMAKYHPNVTLVVIDTDAYRKIAMSVSSLIEGWETGGKGNI